ADRPLARLGLRRQSRRGSRRAATLPAGVPGVGEADAGRGLAARHHPRHRPGLTMRISTSMMHDTAVRSMVERQADLVRAQEQIATGRRILKPSDDPVASSQALGVKQAQARTAQFTENVGNAQNDLGLTESVLAQVTSLLQSVRDQAVAAGN